MEWRYFLAIFFIVVLNHITTKELVLQILSVKLTITDIICEVNYYHRYYL